MHMHMCMGRGAAIPGALPLPKELTDRAVVYIFRHIVNNPSFFTPANVIN
jgi:hypothetical protein